MPDLDIVRWRPELRLPDHDDPVLIEAETDDIPAIVDHLLASEFPALRFKLPDEVQVITPRKKTICGTNVMNQVAQACLNPNAPRRPNLDPDSAPRPLLRDVVGQTVNNYDLQVFNGERGRLIDQGQRSGRKRPLTTYKVDFDDIGDRVEYVGEEIRQLAVAYAISCHRSQGWEYEVVILIMSSSHHLMLTRPLFLTGWSRARQRIYLIGQRAACYTALRNKGIERCTLLRQRIRNACADARDRNRGTQQ
jgi:exodeoxyribonuclease V alpha subunit